MAEKHIANREATWYAACVEPDYCRVGDSVIPFDIARTLDHEKALFAKTFFARGQPVILADSIVAGVDGNAGRGVRSGVAQESGHVWIFEGSSTFFTEGRPTARHLDRCWMNCRVDGEGEPVSNGTLGRIYTRQLASPDHAKEDSDADADELKDRGEALDEHIEENREWLEKNPNGKSPEEAQALLKDAEQNLADALDYETEVMDAIREGRVGDEQMLDLMDQSLRTRNTAYTVREEAVRQVLHANPGAAVARQIGANYMPFTGMMEVKDDANAAKEQLAQGNILGGLLSAGMALIGGITELPGGKVVKGTAESAVDGIRALNRGHDASRTAEAGNDGVVILKRQDFPTRTYPSGSKGGKPEGTRSTNKQNADSESKRGIQRENESADRLADAGYKVEQNPDVPGAKNPDFRIEGEIFDNYSPTTGTGDGIRNGIAGKIESGQTSRVVLNMADSPVARNAIRQALTDRPINGLREIIMIGRDGSIVHFFP